MDYKYEIASVKVETVYGSTVYKMVKNNDHKKVVAIVETDKGLEIHFDDGEMIKYVGCKYELTCKKTV